MKLQFYISNQEIEKSNKMVQKIKVEGINYSAIYWTYIYLQGGLYQPVCERG